VASARAPNMRSKSGGAICIHTTIRLYVSAVKPSGPAWAVRARIPPRRYPAAWSWTTSLSSIAAF